MSRNLTWRNVDAPSFAGVQDGYRTAGMLLNNATKSGEDLIGTYRQLNSDAADRAILNRALGIQDAGQYEAALSNGSVVGPDAANASLATLRSLDTRSGQLLDRATARQTLDSRQYDIDRTKEGNALSDAAATPLAQARLFARNNDQKGLNDLIASSPELQALRPDQLNALLTGADNLATNYQGRRASDTNFDQGNWRFGREQRNAYQDDVATEIIAGIRRNAGSPDQAQSIVSAVDAATPGGLPGGVLDRVVRGAQGVGYNLYGPVDGAGNGAGASSGSRSPASSIMTGGAALPDRIRTVGDMVDTLDANGRNSNLLKDNPKGTATGMYQITGATWADFAPTALGSNWRSADIRSPQVQDQVGRAIWDTVKNNPSQMTGRWASLTPTEAEQLKGAPWETVRDVLSQKESGSRATDILARATSVASNNLGAATAAQQIGERSAQNTATGLAGDFNQLLSDRSTVTQSVDRLVGKDGALRGSNRGVVLDYVNQIVQDSGGRINPAMASEMLARNITKADTVLGRATSIIAGAIGGPGGRYTPSPNLGDGVRVNDVGVQQMMQEYLTGGTSTRAAAQTTLGVANELVQSAQQSYNAAESRYSALANAAKTRPGLERYLDAAKQRRDAAEQALRRVTQSVVNSDTLTPRYDRTGG